MADILREHILVAARKHRDRTSSQPPQLIEPGGVFQHIDGLELDRTDREKLFEFQAARSSRLPEHLQRNRFHDRLMQLPVEPPTRAARRQSGTCRFDHSALGVGFERPILNFARLWLSDAG